MIWLLIILLLLLLILLWFLLAPFQLEVDSRQPVARLNWISIGRAAVWYEKEWWLSFRVFFFERKFRLASMKAKPKKPGPNRVRKPAKKNRFTLKKMTRLLHSFRVQEWRLFLDTGDYGLNARLYPLNYTGKLQQHLVVNFNDENYFYIRIRNSPWRLLWAFLQG